MLSSKKVIIFAFLVVLTFCLVSLTQAAGQRAVAGLPLAQANDAKYVGVGKCKLCHPLQYKSWATTKHAQALSVLKENEAKDPKCLECHVTGYGKPQAEGADLANVQCEACHGAGSNYKSMETMKDLAKAKAAGLIVPNEETCKACHNERSPFFKPPFNYQEMLKKGVHERKS